jgi:hypothetical protein
LRGESRERETERRETERKERETERDDRREWRYLHFKDILNQWTVSREVASEELSC